QALRMQATRANNANSWIDCNFDGNGYVADIRNNNSPLFINCDFTNNGGNANGELINGNEINFYSCNLTGNTTRFIFGSTTAYVEGCNFNDNATLFSNSRHHNGFQYVLNSTSNGLLGGAISSNYGIIINSSFPN